MKSLISNPSALVAPLTFRDDVGVEVMVGFIFSLNSLLEYDTSLKSNCSTLVAVLVSFEPEIVNLFSVHCE